VATEQADLHLLYYSSVIMIKPLPAYLLCKEVWDQHFNGNQRLHEAACGLLLSYIWLIRSPMDFAIAMKNSACCLLPPDLTWPEWKRIVHETLAYIDADSLHQVNKRFQFGELRLDRINKIYRMHPRFMTRFFVRGYLYDYNRYMPFLQRNVAWIFAVSVLISLVLSAMQVGTGVDRLSNSYAFNTASYGFVIFSCILVGAIIVFVIAIFTFVFLYNMKMAISHSNREQKRRKLLEEKKKGP
jgi:uncharacterized membrane protein